MKPSTALALLFATSVAVAPVLAYGAHGAPFVKGAVRHRVFPGGDTTPGRGARRAFATQADVGSSGDVTADPLVTRPAEAPCVDPLFTSTFAAYAPQTFSYAPPAGCPGPYAKIVFNGDFNVSAGVQFDRTASIQLGNVPIYFGTTAEPRRAVTPTWHVERDVTDDAALLAAPQPGEADIFNIVDSTYTGIIGASAYLQFYPARGRIAATATPDLVLPLPGVAGGPQHLDTGARTLSATYTLPQNVDRAYLDVYAQGQQNDEFFYTCAPNDVAAELFDCGNGPLRETEISIDGTPAGTAPVTPWIFTGGIDPYLWAPIPGAETLEFRPYRVDLTPFAGVLSNGRPHVVALSVDNADAYFQGFATFYAFRDPGAAHVTGGLTKDTLVANPAPSVVENLSGTPPAVDGTIAVTSRRSYEIDGYAVGSAGPVNTKVSSTLTFANTQTYSNESATTGTTRIVQATTADTLVTTSGRRGLSFSRSDVSYPLTLRIATLLDATGTGTQTTTVDQRLLTGRFALGSGAPVAHYDSNEVVTADTLDILDGASITGHTGATSSQRYDAADLGGACGSQTIRAAAGLVTSVMNGACDRTVIPAMRRAMPGGSR